MKYQEKLQEECLVQHCKPVREEMNVNKNAHLTFHTFHKWKTTVHSEVGVQVNLKKYKYFAGFSMSSD